MVPRDCNGTFYRSRDRGFSDDEMDSVTASEVVQEAKITQVLIHLRRSLTSDWAALNGVFAADSMACRQLPR